MFQLDLFFYRKKTYYAGHTGRCHFTSYLQIVDTPITADVYPPFSSCFHGNFDQL